MIKLCVCDFDSTLMDGESIDILASSFGVRKEVKDITTQAMNGELDFFESLSKRVSLLKGMSYQQVLKVCQTLPLMQGSLEFINFLKSKNIQVIILSGSFHESITPALNKLKLDLAFANFLHHKDDKLTGLVCGDMMFSNSKGLMLKKLKNFLNLKNEEVMCVGDGANDLAMFSESGLKIAFCAKEILKAQASVCIDKKDLKEIIKVMK